MSDGDADPEVPSASRQRRSGGLRVFRGGGKRRTTPRNAVLPAEVATRLAALERRVEDALGDAGADAFGRELVRALDGTLSAMATLRRSSLADALEGARLLARRELLGEPGDHVAPLADVLFDAAYRWWWRVDVVGLDRVPQTGPVVLVANRSGVPLPYESLMIARALAGPPLARTGARLLIDDWLAALPVVGGVLRQAGGVRATPGAIRRLLERDEAVVVLPEGEQAMAKTWSRRYRLGTFGKGTFARAAIQAGAPIVPVAVIGAEETHPVLARVDAARRLLGLPTLPLTPTFPGSAPPGFSAADQVDAARRRAARRRRALRRRGRRRAPGRRPRAARPGARAPAGARCSRASAAGAGLPRLRSRHARASSRSTRGRRARPSSSSTRAAASSAAPTPSSRSTTRSPAGSSTTPRRSGRCTLARAAPGVPPGAACAARDVAAIGITNQRETTVLWDRRTGQARPSRDRVAGPAHGARVRAS